MSVTRYPLPTQPVHDGLRFPARVEVSAPDVVYESVMLRPSGRAATLSVVQLDPGTLRQIAAMVTMSLPDLDSFIATAQRVRAAIAADGA